MSEKHIAARKAYWASLTPEQRSERMRKMAASRQKKMTFKQRQDHAFLMVKARRSKGML